MNNNKILHLTWKDKDLSEKHKFILKRWLITNPNLKIKFYTDSENDKFIELHFPEYKIILDRFPKKVMKFDFIRLLYLYQYGGIYSDMDVIPLKSIDSFLDLNDVVICEEDRRNAPYFGVDYILSNAVIIAKPKSEFIKYLIDNIVKNSENLDDNIDYNGVLYTTGPLFLNEMYKSYYNKSEITILDSIYFNPMNLSDLKSNIISKNIGLSHLVHLYDGTWWMSECNTNLEFIEKIVNIHDISVLSYSEDFKSILPSYIETKIPKFPKISCLCVTKNTDKLLSKSIDCFLNQVYPNKELIVVYEDDNKSIKSIIDKYDIENIKYIKIDSIPKKTLGELRNISIEKSNGEYVCQWDDDDWYHPLRLWEQFRDSKINKKNGSILSSWLIYDNVENKLYKCRRKIIAGWEGSFLYRKSCIKELYDSVSKGEDTTFIEKIQGDLSVLEKPELYIYRVHSVNTWGYESIYNKIIKWSEPYNSDLEFNFLKKSTLETLNEIYGEILINNKKLSISKLSELEKNYKTGVVIPICGRYKEVSRMLKSIENSHIDKSLIFIFIDETSSNKSPNNDLKTSDLIRRFSTNKFNHIKIFKNNFSDTYNSYKTGFDILYNDFNCINFMTLDSDMIVNPNWHEKINDKLLLKIRKNKKCIISGFNGYENKTINVIGKTYAINSIVSKNMFFNKEIYINIKNLFSNKYYELEISKHILKFGGNLFCLYNSVVDCISDESDVSRNFYYKFKDLGYIYKEYKNKKEVPPIIHRLLLYDDDFPPETLEYLKRFKKINNGFYEILWTERDILSIMNDEEVYIYCNYSLRIQKSDYARYIVLKYYGGIYCDFDIYVNKDFNDFYQKNKKSDLFFEETTTSDSFCKETSSYSIINGKPECNLRIANYIMMIKPFSKNIQNILDICKLRKDNVIREDYDILYTTGPDVISHYIHNRKDIKYLTKSECDIYFSHHNFSHWRGNYKNNNFKISVIMQSYLGDYPGSRTNPEMKFIRAVNSFLDQTNKNSELIIVSDNCDITEKIYNKDFSNNDRIKFRRYNKERVKMYSINNDEINYVGEPRQIGLDIATGDIITYMDSDDFIVKDYLQTLLKYWSSYPELDWIINRSWYDNSKVIKEDVTDYYILFEDHFNPKPIEIEKLDSKWVRSIVKKDVVLQSPGLISHKRTCDVKWNNVSAKMGLSEDILFYKDIMNKYKNGINIHIFGYVRCHLKHEWDL